MCVITAVILVFRGKSRQLLIVRRCLRVRALPLQVGSSGGRLVGRAVEAVVRRVALRNVVISLQSYAVVGAASVLGGVSRMVGCWRVGMCRAGHVACGARLTVCQ